MFIALGEQNQRHYDNMIDLWWVFGLSAGFFVIATGLVYVGKYYGLAFISVMLQFFFAFFGYGASHLPYILDPYITIHGGATHPTTAIALIIVFIAGLFLLVPSLILLMRLFLFDADYAKGKK